MPTIARGAILREINTPFVIEELEWEDVRDDEISVRIVACGVCKSDWHPVVGDSPPINLPALMGHEGTGIVEEVGKNVTRFKPGDHCVMSWIPSCGHCEYCIKGMGQLCDRGADLMNGPRADGSYRVKTTKGETVAQFAYLGAFSEYCVVPEDGAVKVPKDLDLKKIPVLGCRIPTGWGAVINSANAEQGCTALVLGCGGIGHNVIQGLKSVGARIIIAADIYASKEKTAREFGATHFIDVTKQNVIEEVMKITGIGTDYAFDALGSEQTQSQSVEAVHKNGKAVWIGATKFTQTKVDMNAWLVAMFNKSIVGTVYGGKSPFELIPQLIEMYRCGEIKFDEVITKYYKLDQINEAYADMLAGKNIAGCILMDMD
jgi:S-(hydroxymethyl)glutathione dehydrogenase/alcohol dehydrogenase